MSQNHRVLRLNVSLFVQFKRDRHIRARPAHCFSLKGQRASPRRDRRRNYNRYSIECQKCERPKSTDWLPGVDGPAHRWRRPGFEEAVHRPQTETCEPYSNSLFRSQLTKIHFPRRCLVLKPPARKKCTSLIFKPMDRTPDMVYFCNLIEDCRTDR